MRVLQVRNVHEALPHALKLLDEEGEPRNSRNGPVLIGPSVTTIYERPIERVMFWPTRDCNPFYHLYEALWMLGGRRDSAPLTRYAKNAADYADEDGNWHGAYGYRWRKQYGFDQLQVIADRLRKNPDDRRSVLTMWSPGLDLNPTDAHKDLPCNTMATFQRGLDGELNLTVFCRSNDIIWGAYGANAVHFSMLLEYMALWIGCAVGTYTQISVNWHAYVDKLDQVKTIRPDYMDFVDNPYIDGRVYPAQMFHCEIEEANRRIAALLFSADTGFKHARQFGDDEPFFNAAFSTLIAHHYWRTLPPPDRFTVTLDRLKQDNQRNDWIVAAREWVERRYKIWQAKEAVQSGDLSHP